jgi:hypothetical protein
MLNRIDLYSFNIKASISGVLDKARFRLLFIKSSITR